MKHGDGRSYIISGSNKGHLYIGKFREDKYHGEGEYRWPDGDRYRGEFKEDQQCGFGMLTYGNGDKYVGFF